MIQMKGKSPKTNEIAFYCDKWRHINDVPLCEPYDGATFNAQLSICNTKKIEMHAHDADYDEDDDDDAIITVNQRKMWHKYTDTKQK